MRPRRRPPRAHRRDRPPAIRDLPGRHGRRPGVARGRSSTCADTIRSGRPGRRSLDVWQTARRPTSSTTAKVTQPFNPFGGFPMFGDIAKALQGQGPLNWDAARQFALIGATQGQPEHNVDPADRIAYAELARIAGMHVNDVTGGDADAPDPRIITRSQWAAETLEAYRPLFTDMATSLGQQPDSEPEAAADPMMQMMAGLSQMMGPAMMGMSVGSMVGTLSQRVFGLHDLPIPRAKQEVVLVARNDRRVRRRPGRSPSTRCACGCWRTSCPGIGCSRSRTSATRSPTWSAVTSAASGPIRPHSPTQLGGVDPFAGGDDDPMQAIQKAVLRSGGPARRRAVARAARAPTAARRGGRRGGRLHRLGRRRRRPSGVVGGEALRIAEAVRRQRATATPDDIFVEKLLGIRVGEEQVRPAARRSSRASSTGSASPDSPASSRPRAASPPPTRSKPPASTSPESRASPAGRPDTASAVSSAKACGRSRYGARPQSRPDCAI